MGLISVIAVVSSILFAPQVDSVERESRSFTLHFRWDKTWYDADYLDNAATFDAIAAYVADAGPDRVESVTAEVYASPEGVREHNLKLSDKRAGELRWLLCQRLPEVSDKVRAWSMGESWGLLRTRVGADERLSEASRERILRILDDSTISDDTRKWRLANRLGTDPAVGDLYKYLLRAHYKYLRSGVTVVVTLKPVPVVETPPEPDEPPVEPDQPDELIEQQTDSGKETVAVVADTVVTPAPVLPVKGTPIIGLSTNLPYDFTWTPGYGFTSIPSFSLEYYPAAGKFTVGADVEWPMWQHWDTHRFFQIQNITLWTRRYFRPSEEGRFDGFYLFGSANAARYGIGFDDHGWEGEGLGASLGGGHKWRLGKSRLYLDAGLALGVFWSRYDPYNYGNDGTGLYYYDYDGKPEDFAERRMHFLWFGPTRVYISLGVDLFTRRKK